MSVAIDVDGRAIVLRPQVFDETTRAVVYRAFPGATWVRTRRLWAAPLTRGGVVGLVQTIGALRDVGREARVSDAASDAIDAMRSAPVWSARYDVPPVDAATPPWRHQRGAYWFLDWARRSVGSALLDCGMRTGKTRMTLEHLAGLPPADRRAIVFTPAAVVEVWPEQCARHIGDATLIDCVGLYRGSVAKRIDSAIELLSAGSPIVVVLGWSILQSADPGRRAALRDALAGATVVADEIHYAKAPGSKRSRSLAQVAQLAAFRIGASGTPLAHSPLDAYGLFRFLDPAVFGSNFARFRDRYATMGGYGNYQVVGFRNLEDLAARIEPYVYRVTRDVLELPDAQHIDVPVRLPDSAMNIYRDLRDEMVADLRSGVLTVANSLARMTRLAQVASGYLPAVGDDGLPDRDGRTERVHSEKTAALVELLKSCDRSEPWVVFCRFHHDLDEVRAAVGDANRGEDRAAHRRVFEFSGRRKELDDWRATCGSGNGAVLACQIQSGGIGISLVEAAFCAYFSIGYSLAEYQQSLARIHGPEQTRPVAYYHLVARGTVDVAIRRALERREDVLAYVAGEVLRLKEGD